MWTYHELVGNTLSNAQLSGEITGPCRLGPTGTHVSEKKRKRRKHLYETAPIERPEKDPLLEQDNIADQTSAQLGAAQRSTVAEASEIEAAYSPQHNIKFHQVPNTPTRPEVDLEHQQYSSSPHSQLQGDLEAASNKANVARSLDSVSSNPQLQNLMPVEEQRDDDLMVDTSYQDHLQIHPRDLHVHDNNAHTVYGASHSPIPSRVSKRKAKVSRGATTPPASDGDHAGHSPSDINDWLQIVAYKVRQYEQSSSAKFAAEREMLHAELEEALNAKLALQDNLDTVQQQKDDLVVTIAKQKAKLAAYESKVTRFKTFVDGLGNDVDSLKREANSTRRKSEQLAQDEEGRKAERDALFEQLGICAERSAHLKDRALKTCQETQEELQKALQSGTYFEQQLSEKVGLLSEERDRRAQLERQLASALESNQSALQTLQSNSDAMIEKLYEIHEDLKADDRHKEMYEILGKTFGIIQALNSETTSIVEGVTDVKGLVEGLGERSVK